MVTCTAGVSLWGLRAAAAISTAAAGACRVTGGVLHMEQHPRCAASSAAATALAGGDGGQDGVEVPERDGGGPDGL